MVLLCNIAAKAEKSWAQLCDELLKIYAWGFPQWKLSIPLNSTILSLSNQLRPLV